MAIPAFENIKIVDENGMLTPEWRNILQSLFDVLQLRFSDEGLVMPSQTTANIAKLLNSSNGAMVYDSTSNLAKININGSWKTITTS
jgi:hypothetical protein